MPAVLYARFSPRPNEAECDSVEKQIEELRAVCAKERVEIRGEFTDRALSGADHERPGLWDAVSCCRRGDVLMVRAWDRLARDKFLFAMIERQVAAKGATLRSITEPGSCDATPEAELVRAIFQAIAAYQRAQIRARTSARMRQHQRNGRRMSRYAPIGSQVQGKALVPVHDEQAALERIAELVDEGLGYRRIAKALTAEGYPSRTGTWHPTTVQRVIKRMIEVGWE